jgi:hypothetical protein
VWLVGFGGALFAAFPAAYVGLFSRNYLLMFGVPAALAALAHGAPRLRAGVVSLPVAALGTATSGPPEFVVYLATTLATVGVLLYNVDRLIRDRIAAGRSG